MDVGGFFYVKKAYQKKMETRLVAKEYAQKEGKDYNEIFSQVVEYTSVQILLVAVVMHDLELEQHDVKITIFHGDLEGQIYMHWPKGFKEHDKEKQVEEITVWAKAISSLMVQDV